jgi:hypothetical protein
MCAPIFFFSPKIKLRIFKPVCRLVLALMGGGSLGVAPWTHGSRVHIVLQILLVGWGSVHRPIVTVNTLPRSVCRCSLVAHRPHPQSCVVSDGSHSYRVTRASSLLRHLGSIIFVICLSNSTFQSCVCKAIHSLFTSHAIIRLYCTVLSQLLM